MSRVNTDYLTRRWNDGFIATPQDSEAYDRRPHRRVRHTKRTSLCDNRPRCREWSAPVHCPGKGRYGHHGSLQGIAGNIRSVVSDFAPAMAKAVPHVFPDAKHVLDRFHLIQFFTDDGRPLPPASFFERGETSTDRLVGSLSVPSLRASGEDRKIDPEPRGSDTSNNRVQSIERKDGRNEQQNQAHQTPWLWLSKP